MTDAAKIQAAQAAQIALAQGQALLEEVQADAAHWGEVLVWAAQAIDRARRLDEYYRGPGQRDVDAIRALDPRAETPEVASEDAAWEALITHDDNLLRLLRLATAEVTRRLDQ